ncbi:hypothetical protein K2173_018077 [Erythroxylum novogranatense]|uniref:Uncharacterized protein n=1 Tax=Erythroxylum novogranatense TaxID=1862640 RepID=A0AAV8TUF8_9ROSI|nr:hypothetical protein K2173_018077 [Erythroxylum novogranatense]
MSRMKLQIISRKAIKPSSSTPKHLQNFKLSIWDKRLRPVYGIIIFFYHCNANPKDHDQILSLFFKRSRFLQKSLSKTLVHYYPLAGRLNDESIECNDEGAHFVEARIDCHLSTFLNQPDFNVLEQFNPAFDPNLPSGCMLATQVTLFNCGGIAIGVSPSHKLLDGSSLATFIQSWVSLTTIEGCNNLVSPNPIFVDSSFSPSSGLLRMPTPSIRFGGSLVIKRFVFPASKISQLKETTSSGKQYISYVDSVLSLIMKSAISASRSLSKPSSGPYLLFQMVNMRKRLRQPLPRNTMGNISWNAAIEIKENQMELNELADEIREKPLPMRKSTKGDDPYRCSSLCGFPLYKIDFGWGKPSWVTSPVLRCKNFILLHQTKDGNGIEAWICLDEKEMSQFERDQDLLAFAHTNPCVVTHYCRL